MDKKKTEPESGGDPYPDPQPYGDAPIRGRRRRPSILAIGLLVSLSLSAYSMLRVDGALRSPFPQSQTFSIGVSYSFADTPGQVLSPGSTGNITLTIISGLHSPQSIYLSFNSTKPDGWSNPPFNLDSFTGCGAQSRDLTMTVNGQVIVPENTVDQCSNGFGQGGMLSTANGLTSRAQVTVNPGSNTYSATLGVSSSATFAAFTLNWFACQ